MSSKKITDLTSYSAAELSASSGADLLFITDVGHQETKKITALEFSKYATGIGGAYTGSFTGSFTGNLFGTSSWAQSASYATSASYVPGIQSVTAQNIGTAGTGLFDEKVGSTLNFLNIQGGQNVSITKNVTNKSLLIDVSSTVSPGGPQYAIQYNNPVGIFNGDSNFLYNPSLNGSTPNITINGTVTSNFNGIAFVGTSSWANKSISSSYALSSSFAVSASNALTASYVPSQGGVLGGYSVMYSTKETGYGQTWYSTGLSITITPKSVNSKFLITPSIILANGDAPSNAVAGLFIDATPLIEQFTSINTTKFDAIPQSTTYIHSDGTLTPRTYVVKVKSAEANGYWYTNRSPSYPDIYFATSSMTVLEIAY